MDKINVTDEALQNIYIVLQQLNEKVDSIATDCEKKLTGQLNNLDVDFRQDIQKYIDSILNFKDDIVYCIAENKVAISERLSKIPEYESQVYQKRNIT